jgi:hypothetical protein
MKITIVWPLEHLHQSTAALALLAAATLGCTSPAVLPGNGTVVVGRWGAVHAGLTLTDSGGAIEYDCAHGGFSRPLHPDRAGRFTITGIHVPERGGPVRVGEVPDSVPAQYVGQVIGDRMTLRVLVGADTLGPFALRRGIEPQLFKCL